MTGQVFTLAIAGAVGNAHALASAARRGTVIAGAAVGICRAAESAHTIGIVARARRARGAVGAGGAIAGHTIAVGPAEIDLGDAQPVLWTIGGHSTGIAHLASGIATLAHWASSHGEAAGASRTARTVHTSGNAHRRQQQTERLAHVAGPARRAGAGIAGSDADRPVVARNAHGRRAARAVLRQDRAAGHGTVARGESDGRRNANSRQAR